MRALPRVDPTWWRSTVVDGRPISDVLHGRDVAAVFRFLRSRGWSRATIAAATGLTETRVREVAQGKQQITSYEVLERIAAGLEIPRERLGLGYGREGPVSDAARGQPERSSQGNPAGAVLVPRRASHAIHRSTEIEMLVEALCEANHVADQVVAVCGPGGFGKTTLAVEVCHDTRIRELFSDVLWVETGEECTPARLVQLVSDLCVRLGRSRPMLADPQQAGFFLARLLGDRRALLVVDNVWSAADLAPFLLGGPACVRMITTRNRRACPEPARLVHIGPMVSAEVRELLAAAVPSIAETEAGRLADLCQGWPLLASVVGASVAQDVASGAPAVRAVDDADVVLRTIGPYAFDVWDADQQRSAIGQVIRSSLRGLENRVEIPGAADLRARYVSLAVFPPATRIPLSVLSWWWERAFGWSASAVRRFCRLLSDRSLVDAYRADEETIILHDVFRSYLRHLAADEWQGLHGSLLDAYRHDDGRRWSTLDERHSYLWQNLPHHLREAGRDEELVRTLADPDYIVRKVQRFGHESLAIDQQSVPPAAPGVAGADDEPWQAAHALTNATFLLQGLRSPGDIASTLLVALLRTTDKGPAVDRLRHIVSAQDEGFDIQWVVASGSAAITGHIGAVTSVAVCGTLLASGGEDGTVRLWCLDQQRPLISCRGHTGWVYAIAITPDGRIVASAGDDGMIRLWRAGSGDAAGVLLGHEGRVRALAFSGDGSLLASGGEDGQLLLWDANRLKFVRGMDTGGGAVWSVAVDRAGSVVAAAGEGPVVRLYDLRSGELVGQVAGHADWVRSLAFGPAGTALASGSSDRTLRLWNVDGGRPRLVHTEDTVGRVRAVAWTGDSVVTAGEDATLRLHSLGGVVAEQPMPSGVDWIRSIAVVDDVTVVAGCEDGGIRVWSRSGSRPLTTLSAGSNTVWSTAFADGGGLAALGRADGVIEIRDAVTSRLLRTLAAGNGRVWSLAAGGRWVAAACGDGTVRVWTLHGGDERMQLNEAAGRTWAVAINAAGTRVAASSDGGAVRAWDLPSGRLRWQRVAAHHGRIRSMSFTEDGHVLLTGGGDGTARLWNGSDGSMRAEFAVPASWVRTVALGGHGGRAVVGTGPGDLHVFDAATTKPIATLLGHRGRVLAVAASDDVDRLVSAAADGTIRTWSLSQQRQIAEIRVDATLQCACADAAGRRILVASARGAVAVSTTGSLRLGAVAHD